MHDQMWPFWKRTIPKIMEDLDKLEEKRRSEEWNPKKFEEKMKRRKKKREEKREEEMKERKRKREEMEDCWLDEVD